MAQAEDNLIIEPTPFRRADTGPARRRLMIRPLPTLIGIVFMLLAVAAGFMFTARAVTLAIDPTPATISVVDGLPTWRLGERFLMLPGDYRVEASVEGYEPLSEIIDVSREEDQSFSFELVKLPGILTITTEPHTNADVIVDQVLVGTAPLTLESITPGLHDIQLIPERFRHYDTEVEIEGRRIEQTLIAELTPAWANVVIDSLPPDAAIFVDGRNVGTTPAAVEILEGTRQLELRRAGYKVWQTTVAVVALEDQVIAPVQLTRSDGTISITTIPDGANVTIGGRYRGQTPLAIALAPGETYEVLLSKAGYRGVRRSISVEPEQDISLSSNLEPVLGVIRLHVVPDGAELYLDGEPLGEPSRRLELTVQSHDIEIRKEGYATYRTQVTPQPGLAQQLLVQLQTEEEARIAAIPTQVKSDLGVSLKLVLPDRLTLGAGRREPGRRSNEVERDVILTRPYFLSVNEITNDQFSEFEPGHDSGSIGRSLLGGGDRPVVNVSWVDAVRFCNWLSDRDGLPRAYANSGGRWRLVEPLTTGYRLPTEAEWAWAARYAAGNEPTRFPWGDAMPPVDVAANYADESAESMVSYFIAGYSDGYRGTSPVGTFPPNELGIHDLAGNVSEWIHDYYEISLSKETLTDPLGPDTGENHVIRGSNYTHGRFSELRWTYRDYGAAPRPDVGFRIARYVE